MHKEIENPKNPRKPNEFKPKLMVSDIFVSAVD